MANVGSKHEYLIILLCPLFTFCLLAITLATTAPKKVVKLQKDNTSTTKKETAAPKLPKPVPAITNNTSTPVSFINTTRGTMQLVKPVPPVSTKSPSVKASTVSPQQIKPMPSLTTLPEGANKVLTHPAVLLNISQLGKSSVLAVQPNPMIHLTSGEGPKIHSNAVTMSLSPQSIQSVVLPTSVVHQKQHNVTPLQWSQILSASKQLLVNANSAAATSLTSSSGIQKPPLSLVPNIANLSGPSSNSQVLQEHSYQKAEMSTALAASNHSATQSSSTMFPKVVVNPLNLQYK